MQNEPKEFSLSRYMQPKFTIESDDIFVMAGAGACFESLGFSLINPGDVILVPRPYYYQFDHEFHRVSGAELVTFPVCVIEANTGTRCFIKKEDLQLAYDQAASSGAVVKALLIVSPNNPIGYVLEEEVLQVCLDFIKEHNLQLISDEIYMNCIFGEPKFQSVLNIVRSCDDLDNIHITWAFSKDFAVAGFRVGVTITKNEKIKAIFKENLNRRVSNFTLYALEGLITDFNWLNTVYFPEFKKRLAEKTYFITKSLENLGVHVVHCNAGLYVWANFEKYLYSRESKRADELFHCFLKQGIYIAPGKAFGETNPGWFRLITSLEQDRLDKGIKRITEALKIYSHK